MYMLTQNTGKNFKWILLVICSVFKGFKEKDVKKTVNSYFLRLCLGSVLLLQMGGCVDLLYTLTTVGETLAPVYSYPVFTECEYLIDWTWYYGACGLVH